MMSGVESIEKRELAASVDDLLAEAEHPGAARLTCPRPSQ